MLFAGLISRRTTASVSIVAVMASQAAWAQQDQAVYAQYIDLFRQRLITEKAREHAVVQARLARIAQLQAQYRGDPAGMESEVRKLYDDEHKDQAAIRQDTARALKMTTDQDCANVQRMLGDEPYRQEFQTRIGFAPDIRSYPEFQQKLQLCQQTAHSQEVAAKQKEQRALIEQNNAALVRQQWQRETDRDLGRARAEQLVRDKAAKEEKEEQADAGRPAVVKKEISDTMIAITYAERPINWTIDFDDLAKRYKSPDLSKPQTVHVTFDILPTTGLLESASLTYINAGDIYGRVQDFTDDERKLVAARYAKMFYNGVPALVCRYYSKRVVLSEGPTYLYWYKAEPPETMYAFNKNASGAAVIPSEIASTCPNFDPSLADSRLTAEQIKGTKKPDVQQAADAPWSPCDAPAVVQSTEAAEAFPMQRLPTSARAGCPAITNDQAIALGAGIVALIVGQGIAQQGRPAAAQQFQDGLRENNQRWNDQMDDNIRNQQAADRDMIQRQNDRAEQDRAYARQLSEEQRLSNENRYGNGY